MEIVKHVSQDDMTLYSGPGNIHSDLGVARTVGLDRTIAQGMQTLAYASELMTEVCGSDWVGAGSLAVTFTKPVFAGDTVTVRARAEDGSWAVEAVNQDGDVVMVGTASLGGA